MKYQVDQDKLAKSLVHRPALIKTITALTEAFILKIFVRAGSDTKRAELYNAIPLEFKTLTVTRAYLKDIPVWAFDYNAIPADIRRQLSKDDRLDIIARKVSVIEEMENVTPAEWKVALSGGYTDFENIPKDMWTKEMVFKVIGKINYRGGYDFFRDIPGIWDEEFAEDLVKANPETICIVPPHLISNEVLRLGADQNLDGLQIPESAWDSRAAELAVEGRVSNVLLIPEYLITAEMIQKCAFEGMWENLPCGKTYETFVYYMAGNPGSPYRDRDPEVIKWAKKVNPRKFIPETVALGCSIETLHLHGFTITPELWVKILTMKPEYLKECPKAEQTDEMVEIVFSQADSKKLDELAECINLGKIKAHHAPLLINCKSLLLQEIMNKFLKGDEVDGGSNTIEVNFSPSQFAKIRNALI